VKCCQQGETLGGLADNLRLLVDKAFPDLDSRAKELDQFLSLIEDLDATLCIRQRCPKDLNKTVACVLEIEAYLTLRPHPQRKALDLQQPSGDVDSLEVVSAIQLSQDTIIQMLHALTTWVDKLESVISAACSIGVNPDCKASCNQTTNCYSQDQQSTPKQRSHGDLGGPVCRCCGREGHFSRGCAARIPEPGMLPSQVDKRSNPRNVNNVYSCDNNKNVKLLAVNPPHAYHVTGITNGIHIHFMIDTVAAVSLLRADVWDKISTVTDVMIRSGMAANYRE